MSVLDHLSSVPEATRTVFRRPGPVTRALGRLRRLELATRPVSPQTRQALARRWQELPEHVRTPAQLLGRNAAGCEGTHGVFPKCNLACTPCYHSRDANRVRVDGAHTVRKVTEQMGLLRTVRGPHAHAQLIGGEVSLLDPDDHAAALAAMRAAGREPMSMSHGDFDYQYLENLVTGPDGNRRLNRVSFAGHFDMMMFGRRGIPRPSDEASLNPYRRDFAAMFARLRKQHHVATFVAHNMTVTPTNIGQIPDVIRGCYDAGFGMFSFQPAAFVGDHRRWHERYRDTTDDQVWAQIEAGAGTRLPFRALQLGDERCNRSTFGFYVGPDYFPLLDETRPADLRVRDAFLTHLGGVAFTGTPLPLLTIQLARVLTAHPGLGLLFAGAAARLLRRVGAGRLARYRRIRPVTFVMHSFMDAADVTPAWAALQQGRMLDDPRLRATQERLQACSYAMAHPETGQIVPACVQHSVLDPGENCALRKLLPITPVHPAARVG